MSLIRLTRQEYTIYIHPKKNTHALEIPREVIGKSMIGLIVR